MRVRVLGEQGCDAGIHRGAVAPTPGTGQGTSEAQEGKKCVLAWGGRRATRKCCPQGAATHLVWKPTEPKGIWEGVGQACGVQAAWGRGGTIREGASAALSVTLLGVDYIHKYSEDRRVGFLPGREGSEQTRKGKKTGVNAVMLAVT